MTHAPVPAADDVLAGVDIGLVVTDMDGTLLDSGGRVPDETRELLAELRRRGVVVAPASGRQLATLRDLFPESGADAVFVAENGGVVVRGGRMIATSPLDPGLVTDVVTAVRDLSAAGRDVGLVRCCPEVAYVERADEVFVGEARRYYHALEVVEDLAALDADTVKLAAYDVGGSAGPTAESLRGFEGRAAVVVSGRHWVDVMAVGVDKGEAVRALQDELGIPAERTAAFGDYLNDLEMLDAATWSFAMADGHPDVIARARFTAPPNAENGVAVVLRGLVDGMDGQPGRVSARGAGTER